MAYQVTARKWRPQLFKDVVGQEHITSTLKNAILNNRIAHAYLFTGPRGVGKTTTARIFAKSLNCLNPEDAEPCNECEMCKEISAGQSLDIIEIDAASNRGIDEIRTLRESVKYAPTKGKYKIYIVDEVHMLTKESFNAFLKTLEEPPEHTIFIFATTDVHKVPATIISRCQRFDFRRIQMDTIKKTLADIAKKEKIKIDDKTLTIIARKADGALRDAESFFDQVVSFCNNDIDAETVSKILNLIDDEVYFEISDAILKKDFKEAFTVTEKIYQNGWDFIDFMEGLVEHFRNIMTVILTEKTSLTETADVYRERYLSYIDKFSEGDILRILTFLTKAQQEVRFSQNQRLKIEIILTHLIGLEKTETISKLIAKVESGIIPEKKNTLSNLTPPPRTETSSHSVLPEVHKKGKIEKRDTQSNTIQPKLNANGLTFEDVQEKWQSFLDKITGERGLTLGPAVNSLQINLLSGNILSVSSPLDDTKKTIELNKKYLEDISEKVFGKRIHFTFGSTSQKSATVKPVIKNQPSQNQQKIEDPFEEVIINELGGTKIE